MDGNEEAQTAAKLYYFSNQIIYSNKQQDDEMRMSTKYLEFLKFTYADRITYNPKGYGEFKIH